jgi:uncharacterized protein
MSMHPNESRLRAGYAAMARGDGKALAETLDPQARWHIPGSSPLAGEYQGIGAIFDFWKKVMALSNGGIRLEVLDVLANDHHAVVFVLGRSTRKGMSLEERGVHVYELKDGKAISAHFYYEDQAAYDRFWSA